MGLALSKPRSAATVARCKPGIAAARGRYVIMGDADDSYDFSRLEPVRRQAARRATTWSWAIAFAAASSPGLCRGIHRYVGNPVLTGILNLFFHSPIGDAHCGLRGFRKDSFERLKRDHARHGVRQRDGRQSLPVTARRSARCPIVLHPDGRDRRPHLRAFRDGWRHLRFLLLLCPFWLYLVPSGSCWRSVSPCSPG